MMWLLLIAGIVVCVTGTTAEHYKRVCYFGSFAAAREGDDHYTVADITDPSLCTHYIFAFCSVLPDQETLGPDQSTDDGPGGNFEQLTNLKKTNPDLKILLAVGGWVHGSKPFVEVAKDDAKVARFCDNVVKYLRDRNFDGLDLDWEYPAHRGSTQSDRERFTFLLETMMRKFEEEANVTGKPRLLLTSAVPMTEQIVLRAYEVAKIAKVLDFINLMAYDLDVSRNGLYYNAPLYRHPGEEPPYDTLNVHDGVELWINNGMPREKIILGFPIYARRYTVKDDSQFQYGEPMKVNSTIKAFRQRAICDLLRQNWTLTRDDVSKTAIMHNDLYWMNYEDDWTLTNKCNYLKDKGLGGFMIWELSLDDFEGKYCNKGTYPYLSKLKQLITAVKVTSRGSGLILGNVHVFSLAFVFVSLAVIIF